MHTLDIYKRFLECDSLSTDTRSIVPGCMFWGLKGETFDGGEFCEQAIENGARYAVRQAEGISANPQIIHVADSLFALQELARHHRRSFGIPVMAVTGTNGKTTTKELLNAVFAAHYKTHCTKGNLNNHIGVPLTLLAMKQDVDIAIIEMGANHVGEINQLCTIAEPTCGLITNIGKAHLEGFGSLEGVKRAKSELYQYLDSVGGVIFVNMDEAELVESSMPYRRKIPYQKGVVQPAENFPSWVDLESGNGFLEVSFRSTDYGRINVQTQIVGEYNFNNIMTAIVVGQYFKVPDQQIKSSLENFIPANNRSQIIQRDNYKILLDAYNANPSSMTQALNNFTKIHAQRKIVILGDMFELGEYSRAEHQSIADLVSASDFEASVLVGKEFAKTRTDQHVLKFTEISDLKQWFDNLEKDEATILIKGSRGMKLETLLA